MKVHLKDFVPCVEYDTAPDVSYMDQDGFEEEKTKWLNDEITAYSVHAMIELKIPYGSDFILHTVKSPGCYGVMLYSHIEPLEDEHVLSIVNEESLTLRDMLTEMGIAVDGEWVSV